MKCEWLRGGRSPKEMPRSGKAVAEPLTLEAEELNRCWLPASIQVFRGHK